MYEIYCMALLFVVLAHRRRRKRVRLIKGQIDESVALSTLAAETGILAPTDTVDDTSYLISTEMVFSIREHTAGQGPLVLYWAHSDYTLAEIEEFIELQTGWGQADEVSKEISRRKVKLIGQFSGSGTEEILNDGRLLKTKVGFVVSESQGLNLVVYNGSGSTLTSGTIVEFKGHCWIKPM